jgi:hypothetical protein
MSVGTLLSMAVPGFIVSLGCILPGCVPLVPIVEGAAVPTGAFAGVLLSTGVVVCAEAVAAIAPNEAINKVLRSF